LIADNYTISEAGEYKELGLRAMAISGVFYSLAIYNREVSRLSAPDLKVFLNI
jgi:hypothetical protein